jgi:hypothetical protein
MADPLTTVAFQFLFQFALAQSQPGYEPAGPSLPEVAERVLHCYHPTGRFHGAALLDGRWPPGYGYSTAAEPITASVLIRIDWAGGFTNQPYATDVALVERGNMVLAVIQGDNAPIGASRRCPLDTWQPGAVP